MPSALAAAFEVWVTDEPGWEIAPRLFSTVCFRRGAVRPLTDSPA